MREKEIRVATSSDDVGPLPDLELESAIRRNRASFQQWAETYFYSLRSFSGDDDDARRNYRDYRPGVFAAFEADQGPIDASYYCQNILAAAVVTSRPRRPFLRLIPRRNELTLHIMNNVTESEVEDSEILELTRLLYACQDMGRRTKEFLRGSDRVLVVRASFDVATDVLAVLDTRKGAPAPAVPHAEKIQSPGAWADRNEAVRELNQPVRANEHRQEGPTAISGPHQGSSAAQPTKTPSALLLQQEALQGLREMFDRSVTRQARLVYLTGMLLGAVAVGLLGAAMGWLLPRGALSGVNIPNLVGAFVGGAVGAVVSVLTRLGNATVRYEVGRVWLRILGGLRPLIGAVFGVAFFALTSVGILPFKVLSPEFLFFFGLGFLAGFNERWAQGVVIRSGAALDQAGS